MNPTVSCILATIERRPFLQRSIEYFLSQTYENKELIIVEDGEDCCADLIEGYQNIQYIRLDHPTILGPKLNIGIEAAKGEVIQKLDDDDYYHSDFLTTNMNLLLAQNSENVVVCYDDFLVFLVKTRKLKITEKGWCAGATFCFHKDLWRKKSFRPVGGTCDWFFLEDHTPLLKKISGSELYIMVRHTKNKWNTIHAQDVDDYMATLPDYSRSIEQIMGMHNASFYLELSSQFS